MKIRGVDITVPILKDAFVVSVRKFKNDLIIYLYKSLSIRMRIFVGGIAAFIIMWVAMGYAKFRLIDLMGMATVFVVGEIGIDMYAKIVTDAEWKAKEDRYK